jgi:hypothetical protein
MGNRKLVFFICAIFISTLISDIGEACSKNQEGGCSKSTKGSIQKTSLKTCKGQKSKGSFEKTKETPKKDTQKPDKNAQYKEAKVVKEACSTNKHSKHINKQDKISEAAYKEEKNNATSEAKHDKIYKNAVEEKHRDAYELQKDKSSQKTGEGKKEKEKEE